MNAERNFRKYLRKIISEEIKGIAENTGEYIYRDGEIIYVNVSSRDSYVLQVVNAAGLPMATLFNGTWNEGEHSVNVSDFSLSAGAISFSVEGPVF